MTQRNPLMIELCDLELSVRTDNMLRQRAGILTIGELASKSEAELLKIDGFGRKCLNEVKEILGSFNMSLREGPILTLEQQMQSALAKARAAKHTYEAAMSDVKRIAQLLVDQPITELDKPQ